MPNEMPKQLYIARFALKSGAQFDVVTELTREEIEDLIKGFGTVPDRFVCIPGINTAKQWPVDLTVDPSEVDCFFHGPHEQWLAGRKVVGIAS